MASRKTVLWLCAISGGLFSLAAQATNYNVVITGRLSDAGQLIGSVNSGPVRSLNISHIVHGAGLVNPELTFHLGGPGGAVVPNLSLVCIQKNGVLTSGDVCNGGVAVNLPPAGISWRFAEVGVPRYLQNAFLSVTPQGRYSNHSFVDGTGDFDGPNADSTRTIYYEYTGTGTTYNPGDDKTVNGTINAFAGEGTTPGVYTGQISVSGGPYADTDTTNYTINVLPPLPKCTITPPPLVNFGTHKITQETFIATASTTIQGSCTDSDPADVGKGMYMTFYAGSHGWYDSNSQKLATSLDGIYVTGDSDTPVCSGGNMYFDGQPREDYKVGSIEQAGDKDFSKTLNFALCRDTTKKVAPGAMETSVFVDVVVQ